VHEAEGGARYMRQRAGPEMEPAQTGGTDSVHYYVAHTLLTSCDAQRHKIVLGFFHVFMCVFG